MNSDSPSNDSLNKVVSFTLPTQTTSIKEKQTVAIIETSKDDLITSIQRIVANSDISPEDLAKDGVGSKRREGVMNGMKRAFSEDKNWKAISQKAPLGYEFTTNDWIQPTEKGEEIAQELFESFLRSPMSSTYQYTADTINEQYSESVATPISKHRVKTLLQNPVYIGKPTLEIPPPGETEAKQIVVEDEALKLVNKSIFEKAQNKIENVTQKHNGSEFTYKSVQSIAKEYSPELVTEVIEMAFIDSNGTIRLECTNCDADSPLIPWGGSPRKYLPDGVRIVNYKCESCGKQTNRPHQSEMFEIMRRSKATD